MIRGVILPVLLAIGVGLSVGMAAADDGLPDRSFRYVAFDHGKPLIDELGNELRFSTRAAARAYEEEFRQPLDEKPR